MTATLTIDTLRLTGPHQALNRALRGLAEKGETIPCAGSDLPTHNHADKRAQAVATMCGTCPVRQECAAAGATEHHGVWGGTDIGTDTGTEEWTDREDDILRSHMHTHDAYAALPHRTEQAIRNRARRIGHTLYGQRWSPHEEQVLRDAPTRDAAYRALPHRTPDAIDRQAIRLGLQLRRSSRWSDDDDAVVTGSTTAREAAQRLGRTIPSVYHRAQLLGHSFVEAKRKDAA